MHNPTSKTPAAYYGGKIGLLAHIHPMIPVSQYEVYTESFAGGLAVMFSIPKVKNETINDIDGFVVNFWRQLQNNYKELKQHIDGTLMSREMHNEALHMWRNQDEYLPVKKAWAFWLLTNFSYANKLGGGLKYSNDMKTVVPNVMRNKKGQFTDELVTRIEGCYIEQTDALWILESRNVAKAFHYIDSPYHNADMGHYAKRKWTEKSLVDLLQWCETCKGKFLLSNYNSEPLEHYTKKNGWYKKEITHRIQKERKSGTAKVEVLTSNYSQTDLINNRLFI